MQAPIYLVHGVHPLLDIGGDLVLGGEALEGLVRKFQDVLQHHLWHGRVQNLHGADLGIGRTHGGARVCSNSNFRAL